jgi:hypothetical protein
LPKGTVNLQQLLPKGTVKLPKNSPKRTVKISLLTVASFPKAIFPLFQNEAINVKY